MRVSVVFLLDWAQPWRRIVPQRIRRLRAPELRTQSVRTAHVRLAGICATILQFVMDEWPMSLPFSKRMRALFHCNGFCEISGLVDVTSTQHSDVICQKLKRGDLQNCGKQFRCWRNVDHVLGFSGDLVVTFGRESNGLASSGSDFLEVRHRLFIA